MGGASFLCMLIAVPTMLCVDGLSMTGHINICMLMRCLVLHIDVATFSPCSIDLFSSSMLSPFSIKINLLTNLRALLVHDLAVRVVAVVRTTLFEEGLIIWFFQKDVHIALDLLSGRPIDLAVLLQALLCLVCSLEFCLALAPANVVSVITVLAVTSLILAI
jgi:hypothetical protein